MVSDCNKLVQTSYSLSKELHWLLIQPLLSKSSEQFVIKTKNAVHDLNN